jgi:hypothetical protein
METLKTRAFCLSVVVFVVRCHVVKCVDVVIFGNHTQWVGGSGCN